MLGSVLERVCMTDAPNAGLGRIATKRHNLAWFRCWLQAAVRRIAICVGFISSSGNTTRWLPVMIEQRTQVDKPWTAACDPKPTSVPRSDSPLSGHNRHRR